eukprot:scaffold81597_cov16-Prasinocladus_malaysianus.AAC.1
MSSEGKDPKPQTPDQALRALVSALPLYQASAWHRSLEVISVARVLQMTHRQLMRASLRRQAAGKLM